MYCQVFFTQDTETLNEIENLLYDEGGWVTTESIHDTAQYMSNWDYGAENEHEDNLAEEIEDSIYVHRYLDEETGYTIVIQAGLFAALWREAEYY